MIEITTQNLLTIETLDHVARLAYGPQTSGVSVDSTSRIHIEEAADPALAYAIFDNFDALIVNTNTTTIAADDIDTATITHTTADAQLDYIVLLDGNTYATGTVIPAAGTATLELTTAIPGEYEVWLIRKTGNFATGHTTITAT